MSAVEMVDMAFGLRGEFVPRDYADPLYRAIVAVLGWLDDEPAAGVHPLKGGTPMPDAIVLGRRAQLVLRVPARRAAECAALAGASLDVGAPLVVGEATRKELMPHPVLYSHFVTTGADDEGRFHADVVRLAGLAGYACQVIVGKRRESRQGQARITGHSLMLHGLSAGHSLAVQCHGLGDARKLGCGLFVPHRSIAPIGE